MWAVMQHNHVCGIYLRKDDAIQAIERMRMWPIGFLRIVKMRQAGMSWRL